MASSEVGEDAVRVLSVDFGEEVFASSDFSFNVHVGCVMVSPVVKHVQKWGIPFRLGTHFCSEFICKASSKSDKSINPLQLA